MGGYVVVHIWEIEQRRMNVEVVMSSDWVWRVTSLAQPYWMLLYGLTVARRGLFSSGDREGKEREQV